MNIFLKRTHIPHTISAVGVSIFIWGILRWYIPQFGVSDVANLMVKLLVFIVLLVLNYGYFSTTGLYIKNNCIYYKNFRKKGVTLSEVAAIKITRAVMHPGDRDNLFDKNGNQLYVMFLVRGPLDEVDLAEDLKKDMSNNYFKTFNGKHIICSCIYDQSVIDYLLTLNPNIIVF